MPDLISEDQIEQALLPKLQRLRGFDLLHCNTEVPHDLSDGLGESPACRAAGKPARIWLIPQRLTPAWEELRCDLPTIEGNCCHVRKRVA